MRKRIERKEVGKEEEEEEEDEEEDLKVFGELTESKKSCVPHRYLTVV